MGSKEVDLKAIETAMVKWETIERLRRGIDNNYRRCIEGARNEWERGFDKPDPSDACVSVHFRLTAPETMKSRCSAVVTFANLNPHVVAKRGRVWLNLLEPDFIRSRLARWHPLARSSDEGAVLPL
jgi:hypothetical protein